MKKEEIEELEEAKKVSHPCQQDFYYEKYSIEKCDDCFQKLISHGFERAISYKNRQRCSNCNKKGEVECPIEIYLGRGLPRISENDFSCSFWEGKCTIGETQ